MTPITIDTFSRFMADVFDEKQIIGVSTVGQAFFGRTEHGSRTVYSPDANDVDIDIMRGNERIAALIPRGTVSRHLGSLQKNQDTQNYSTFSRTYPLAEEMGDINANEILYRLAGENPYQQRERLDRMRDKALEHHLESIRRIVRLFEVLSWQSLRLGTQDAIVGTSDTNLQYDFRRSATHSITPTIAWDAAGATIFADIDAACELVRQDGKETPNFIFLSGDVMDAFINDSAVQTQADNRRFELIEVSLNNPVPPRFQPLVDSGAIPYGRIRTPRGYTLWIFTYVDDYENAAGTRVKYLPDGEAFLGYYGARCDRYFGPPERLPVTSSDMAWYQEMFGFNMMMPPMPPKIKNQGSVLTSGMFYCDAYPSGDKKKVTIRTQAAPIFATTQTDAFVRLYNLTSEES